MIHDQIPAQAPAISLHQAGADGWNLVIDGKWAAVYPHEAGDALGRIVRMSAAHSPPQDVQTPLEMAQEFARGAFGPFGVDTAPYAAVIEQLIELAIAQHRVPAAAGLKGWEQIGWLRDYDVEGEEVTEICAADDPGAYAIYRGIPPHFPAVTPTAAPKTSGTFLGYRDEHGREMHCAHAKCPDARACFKGCISPTPKLARAALSPERGEPAMAGAADEFGWIIEKDDPPVYHLISGDYDEHWTSDADKALRFARKADAQAYVDHVGWTSPPVRTAEHMWVAPRVVRSSLPDRVPAYADPNFRAREEIEGLRAELAEWKQAASVEAGLRREFAAEIERLRVQVEKAKSALHEIVTNGEWCADCWGVERDIYEIAYNADLALAVSSTEGKQP